MERPAENRNGLEKRRYICGMGIAIVSLGPEKVHYCHARMGLAGCDPGSVRFSTRLPHGDFMKPSFFGLGKHTLFRGAALPLPVT